MQSIATLIVLAFGMGSFLGPSSPFSGLRVHAYLDRLPQGVQALGAITVHDQDRSRFLHIVSYEETGVTGFSRFETKDFERSDFDLAGDPELIDRLLEAKDGSGVRVAFYRRRSAPVLVLGTVESPWIP